MLVWLVYLQLFARNYRRQMRATLLISRGPGAGLEARCFLSNMSSGPIYVLSVLGTVETDDDVFVTPVTDRLYFEGEAPLDSLQRTRQGPLPNGGIRDIGSFDGMVKHVLSGRREPSDVPASGICAITIEVVGIYGSEDLPVGARRRFLFVDREERLHVRGEKLDTSQIRKKRERRKLLNDLSYDR